MTPRRTGRPDAAAPDLTDVKATDDFFDRLAAGGSGADDAVTRSLSAFAAFAQVEPPATPPLDDLLLAAGLIIRPATADQAGGLEQVGHADLSLLDAPQTQPQVAASSTAFGRLAVRDRMPWIDKAGRRVALVGSAVSEQAGRGLLRIGVDTERIPRISPMVAAAAAVVAFGLTGVATGMLGADPLSGAGIVGAQQASDADAEQVADLLDKARILVRAGRVQEAQQYYYAASALVRRLPSAPERAELFREVELLRVNLGLPKTEESETGDGRTPATPDATTVAAVPEVLVPTLSRAATPPPQASTSEPPAPSTTPEPSSEPTTTEPTTTEPSTTTTTTTPTPDPTPTPTESDDSSPVGDPASDDSAGGGSSAGDSSAGSVGSANSVDSGDQGAGDQGADDTSPAPDASDEGDED